MHNIREMELGSSEKDHLQKTSDKKEEEDEDVDCPDTKIVIWEGDQYEEFQSDYLNQIFPYKINKKTMASKCKFLFHFLSSSLHYWIELVQDGEPEEGRLGAKDVKFISEVFQEDQSDNWIAFRRWGLQFNKKQQFFEHQTKENQFQAPKGQQIHKYTRGDNEFVVVKYFGNNQQFIKFKKRFEVLFLFYIDGVSFVNQEVDTWEYFVIYKAVPNSNRKIFVGVLSKYVFRLTSQRQRDRISQVLILPSYQKSGHGKQLLDVVYDQSLKNPACFQITTEVPSFEFQCLRDYKECEMILKDKVLDLSKLIKVKNTEQIDINRANLLNKESVRLLKEKWKLPGHQIQRLANILMYSAILDQKDDEPLAHFEEQLRQKIITNLSPFKTRKKLPNITLYGTCGQIKDFLLQKAKQELLRSADEVQERFDETLQGYRRVIAKLKKVGLLKE